MTLRSGSIDNKWAMGIAMAWRRTGNKALPESMATQFTDMYMDQKASMS